MMDAYRRRLEFMPATAFPDNPDLGLLYPWRAVVAHVHTSQHRSAVESAKRVLADLPSAEARSWRIGLSGGKDSTALALLFQEVAPVLDEIKAMSVKDDLDYPGEVSYVRTLWPGVDIIEPPVSLRAFLRDEQISLVEPLHDRSSDLSARWFYGLIDQYRAEQGYDGVVLGIRQEESRGRRMNIATRGRLYKRKCDGLWVCNPLANWSTLDVHAFVWARGWALHPLYLCVDPGMEWHRLRKSWWVVGGAAARVGGHYVWLRRWWPELWEKAVDIDPRVSEVS